MTEENPLAIAQWMQPDHFFSATQQQKLSRLMAEWRTQRDQGESLAPDTQQELEGLVEAEVLASAARTTAMLDDLAP